MEAMDPACCQWFAGPDHTLEDFHQLMERLIMRKDSQYSYRNTLVAVTDSGEVAAACVSYDGALLRKLRQPFIEEALTTFGRDYSSMKDETAAGELYIDSLCVEKAFRRQGIAGLLTGLLVDTGNPKAERLYHHIGFSYVDDNEWGGHKMKHLQKPLG